jgi:hypothetical protein
LTQPQAQVLISAWCSVTSSFGSGRREDLAALDAVRRLFGQ